MAAAEHQLHGGAQTHQTGRALRATRTWQQAKLNFGQTQTGIAQGQPVVGGHGDFQPPAQRRAVDGGNDRLVAGFDAVAHLGQAGWQRWFAKFADVRASDEGATGAHDQHSAYLRVGLRLLHGLKQTPAHLHIQGIDRRVVEGDNQDIARTLGADGGCCRKAHTKLQKAKNHRSGLSVLSFGKIGLTITRFIDRVSNKFDV